MANFSVTGMDALMKQLGHLGDVEELAKKMVDAAVPELEESVKSGIKEAANRGYATGELANSVKGTKAKINNYGVMSAVRVTGTDKRGMRNGEKMAYLEYGTSKQNPHPVMQKAVNRVKGECIQTMQEVYNREIGE